MFSLLLYWFWRLFNTNRKSFGKVNFVFAKLKLKILFFNSILTPSTHCAPEPASTFKAPGTFQWWSTTTTTCSFKFTLSWSRQSTRFWWRSILHSFSQIVTGIKMWLATLESFTTWWQMWSTRWCLAIVSGLYQQTFWKMLTFLNFLLDLALPFTHSLFAYQIYQNRAYLLQRYNNFQLVYYFAVHHASALGHWFFLYGLAQALTINYSCLSSTKKVSKWFYFKVNIFIWKAVCLMMFSIRMNQVYAAITRLTSQKVVTAYLYDLCRQKYLETVLFFLQTNKMY